MSEEQRPHVAVINVSLEVHSVLDSGECSGKVVSTDKLSEYNIKPHFLLSVTGNNMEDCLSKLKNKIEEIHGK